MTSTKKITQCCNLLLLSLALIGCAQTPEDIERENQRESRRIERCNPPGNHVGKVVWAQENGCETSYSFESGEIWEHSCIRSCWTRIK
jgi:hypothetical protein